MKEQRISDIEIYGPVKEEILMEWECLCGKKIEATDFDLYDILIPHFEKPEIKVSSEVNLADDFYPLKIGATTKKAIKNVRSWRHKKCLMDIKSQNV